MRQVEDDVVARREPDGEYGCTGHVDGEAFSTPASTGVTAFVGERPGLLPVPADVCERELVGSRAKQWAATANSPS